MLRPSFPGGVPYPPRPGEPGVRYAVFPPGSGAGAPPPASSYSRDPASVYGRQAPPEVRSSSVDRAGARMAAQLRNPPYPLYPGDFRDNVQVLSVGGRAGEGGVHVVPPPTASSLPSLHPVLEAGSSMSSRDPKRARIGDNHGLPPLRIDTREVKEPGYHPQVEAISPTPDDRTTERDDVRSTKEDLLQKISKVDREIAKAESQIAKLKKKQHELEDAANKPSTDAVSEENTGLVQSLAQMVYSENRRKAEESHAALDKFSAKNALPLYNQPSDTEQYINNKKNYTVFKKKLVEYFKKAQAEREQTDRNMLITYCKLSVRWNKKVDRIENSRKRKEREAKCREMYEKMFPELRKQREDKERDARLGTRGVVKSDADFEDVIERLQEQENEDKKMHSYAVIPPLLLPSDLIKRKFTNTNGLIPDPMVIYNDRKYVNMWTDQEKETFREKFLQHPKNFGAIAQYLERKTVADCVHYYYHSKKTENYKQLLRKSKIRRPRAPRQQPQAPPPEVIGAGLGTTRPWTRNMAADKGGGSKEDGPSVSGKGSRSGTPNIVKNEENGDGNEKETGKKKPDRARDAKKTSDNQNDSSDDEDNQAVKSGPHPCVICKQIVDTSRAITKAQATQLGLKEEDIKDDSSRVCNKCWCSTLKKKHVCPVESCTSNKGRNRAKLRHLPSKWADLDSKSKEVIMAEFQLPEGSKKVCTTCFTRITRRISQLDVNGGDVGSDNAKKDKDESVNWTDVEIESARVSLKNNGTNWSKMSEMIKGKTEEQCKKFFYSQRKRLQLDKLVTEYKKSRSDKPSLTSDEESGSTTSSCEDEPSTNDNNKDDTKPEPIKAPAPPENKEEIKETAKKEEDCDSAATVSADETGGPGAPGQPAGENMSMKEMMEIVISKTLQDPAKPGSSTTAPQSSQAVMNLGSMLNDAPPVPSLKNLTTRPPDIQNLTSRPPDIQNLTSRPPDIQNLTSRPTDIQNLTSRPGLEVRPVSAPAGPAVQDLTILDLTTSKPGRSASPATGGQNHTGAGAGGRIEIGYPGMGRGPPPEPVPESRGQAPPPAHGGDAKSKTTHTPMMQQDSPHGGFPPIFRKDTKSPAPFGHSPGLIPRGDPRKDIGKPSSGGQSSANPHPASKPRDQGRDRPGGSSGGGGSGSIMQGTPHQPPRPSLHPPNHPRPYEPSKGSILTGHPLAKPISPRGPPGGRPGSSQPPIVDPYKYNLGNPHPVHRSEPSPTGTIPSSSSRGIIAESYDLKSQMAGAHALQRGMDPRGSSGPRDDKRSVYPVSSSGGSFPGHPYVSSRSPFGPSQAKPDSGMRGDPRADIPTRDMAGPTHVSNKGDIPRDHLGRQLQYTVFDQRSRPGQGPPASQGSITQGTARPSSQSSRDVEIFPRHPEVIITKQTAGQPQPQSSRGQPSNRPDYGSLAVLANAADNRDRIPPGVARPDPRIPDLSRSYDPRSSSKPPESSRAHLLPGQPHQIPTSEEQKQVMNRLSSMSEAEKLAYYNSLTSGHLRNTPDGNMTASLLIEAIITHQINKNTTPGQPPELARHSPQSGLNNDKPESPNKVPSRSPSVNSIEAAGGSVAGLRTSTMGEHIENMINKEVNRSTPGPSEAAQEHWKRRGYPPPSSDHPGYPPQQRPPSNSHPGVLGADERQILRVASLPGQDRPDKPPSRGGHEAISPPTSVSFYAGGQPDPAMARYFAQARRKDAEAAGSSSKPGPGYVGAINDDYLKHKITEMMKNEKSGGSTSSASMFTPADLAAKAMSMGPPHKRPLDLETRGSPSDQPPNPESPRKKYKTDEAPNDAPDSPESGNMVIDETARPDSAHSHKTASPAPMSASGSGEQHPGGSYPGFRGQLPPRSSPAPGTPSTRPPPANPRYEPLSDDD